MTGTTALQLIGGKSELSLSSKGSDHLVLHLNASSNFGTSNFLPLIKAGYDIKCSDLDSSFQPDTPSKTTTGRWRGFMGVASALLYGGVAVAMNFINKWTMSVFPLANVVLLLQMLATLVLIQPLLDLGHVTFKRFNWARCRQLVLVCQLYTANTAFALYGLRTLNVPMYSTIKRLTPMMVLVSKSITNRKLPERPVASAVFVVVLGTILAGAGDLSFDYTGYLFAILSCASQAAYLLLTEHHANSVSTAELLYYNAITSLPTLIIIIFLTGEAQALPAALATAFETSGKLQTIIALAVCSFCGCLLNYSLFLCTMTNSALTTTIVGVLKGVIAVILGFFLLGGAPFTPLNTVGISLNTAGGIAYTVHKFRKRRSRGEAPKPTLIASCSTDALHAMSAAPSHASLTSLFHSPSTTSLFAFNHSHSMTNFSTFSHSPSNLSLNSSAPSCSPPSSDGSSPTTVSSMSNTDMYALNPSPLSSPPRATPPAPEYYPLSTSHGFNASTLPFPSLFPDVPSYLATKGVEKGVMHHRNPNLNGRVALDLNRGFALHNIPEMPSLNSASGVETERA